MDNEKNNLDLSDIIGTKVEIEKSSKTKNFREKELFITLVEAWKQAYLRDLELYDYDLDISQYTSIYHLLLEQNVIQIYGEIKAEVICWWIYSDEENLRVTYKDINTSEEKEVKVNTSNQLYNFLKKI